MALVTIATFPTITHLYVIKGQLEGAGIPCMVKDQYTVGVNPLYDIALGGIKLQVREEDVEEAKRVLQEIGFRQAFIPPPEPEKRWHPLVQFLVYILCAAALLSFLYIKDNM